MLKALGWRAQGFARNTRANVAVLFGLAIIPIVLGVGVAIDYGRALIVRERMASAADAAALAIGSWTGLTEAELKTKAQQYFNANYPSNSLGTVGTLNVRFQGDNVLVDVSGSVPTTFMRLANINSVDVGSSAVISKKERNIELALVLDTTGSMGQGGKMSALQSAAKTMVKDLFAGQATSDTLKIAVVPFAAAVNVGSDKKDESWIDKNAKSQIAYEDFKSGVKVFDLYNNLKNRSWQGCVREREGTDYELTDATPDASTPASLFAPYFAPDEPDSNIGSYANSYISDGDCGQSKSKNRTADRCQRYTGKYANANASSGKGPEYNCPPSAITDLTNKQSDVTSAIDNLQPAGSTVIPAGLLWGWRVLSPTAPFTVAKPYDDEKWVKAIVLLTDGQNDVGGGSNGHDKSYYNAFGFAAEGHLGNTNGNNAESTLESKMSTVCTAIKAKGILVYTIGFQVTDSTTKNLLKNCATQSDMYYNSPSNSQLASIFKDIAQGLSDLRIAE
jgi:Flp pilus assembly protein TadG